MPAHPEFNLGLRPSSQSGDAGRVTSIPATQRMKACAPSRACGLGSGIASNLRADAGDGAQAPPFVDATT